jgi:hypothetical protein
MPILQQLRLNLNKRQIQGTFESFLDKLGNK